MYLYLLIFKKGTLTLFGGLTNANIRTFVILYVIGNVIALCATGFLLGPKSQCMKMWDPTRRYSTAFYLAMLIIVLAVAVSVSYLDFLNYYLLLLFYYDTFLETKYLVNFIFIIY